MPSGICAPCFFRLSTLSLALRRVSEVPSLKDSKPVEPLLEVVAQKGLDIRYAASCIRDFDRFPLLRLHFSTREDQQVSVLECVGRTCARHQEADGVAALLKMILEPPAEARIEVFRLFRQHQDGQAVVPAFGLLDSSKED